ncbi:MAG: TolC family protein [Deltaproteobacteria bacterium]|nr:MAG: TolC family protein [Deltaproteobacteria bacterium]
MKRLSTILLISMAVAFGLNTVIPVPLLADVLISAPPPLAELLEEGLAENKEIQSLAAQVESLKEEISFAGSLEDPRLGLGVLNLPTDTFNFDQEPMTQKVLFLAQKVPWFGKLSLKSKRTALMASRQQAVLEAKKLELARRIATAYYEVGFVASNLEINSRLMDMVSQLLKVAETRYASGEGLQQDVLQAQVELTNLLDEKIVLKRKRRTLEDQINGLLNRESFASVIPPKPPMYADITLDFETLKSQSLSNNPWLRVRQAEVNQAVVEEELANKDYWPNMDFKVAYGQREEDFTGRDLPDFVSATVTFTIPLWAKSRQGKKLAASKKTHEAAIKSYRNLVETLPHRVDALATEIRDTQENYRLYVDALLVQSEQWARSSLAAYEVGKVEFNTMVSAQLMLLRAELQAKRYLYSIYQKLAELEEVIGGPLDMASENVNKSS